MSVKTVLKKKKHAMVHKTKKQAVRAQHARALKKNSLEERLMQWDEEDDDEPFSVSEEMRQKLLKEEFKLRKKQPTAWTKTKYRKFAMFAFNRKKKDAGTEEKQRKKLADKNRLED